MFVPPVFLFFNKPFKDYAREEKERKETAKILQESRVRDYQEFLKCQNEYQDALESFEKKVKEAGLYEDYIGLRVKSDKWAFSSGRFRNQV